MHQAVSEEQREHVAESLVRDGLGVGEFFGESVGESAASRAARTSRGRASTRRGRDDRPRTPDRPPARRGRRGGPSYINGSDALDQAGRVEESIALALEGVEGERKLGLDRATGDFLRAEAAGRLLRPVRWGEAEELLQGLSQRTPTGETSAVGSETAMRLIASNRPPGGSTL